MCPLCRLVVLGFWLLVRAASMLAQGLPDPTGHWEGSVTLPNAPLFIEVDVTRSASGELAATFAEPFAGVKGFPFSKVELEGRTLRLVLKASAETSTFTGTLSEDGKNISGDAEQAGLRPRSRCRVPAPRTSSHYRRARAFRKSSKVHGAERSTSMADRCG